MADVWLALHRPAVGAARLVVIKRILRERAGDPRFIELFLQEGRLCTQLEHPNIVHTIEMGCAGGAYNLALDYLRGQTVLGLLGRAAELRRFVPLGVVLRIATDVVAGLAYAHAARDHWGRPLGLVHRDISPSNLFVTYEGAGKVLDFGIALAETVGGRGPVKGKLPYVAPEQARGQPVDPRSDIFALGVVLHEMITLRPLFRGQNEIDTVRRVLEQPVPKPSTLRPSCPPEIDDIVMAMLERDPARRPQRAAAVLPLIDAATRKLGIVATAETARETMHAGFPREIAADRDVTPEALLASGAGDTDRITLPDRPHGVGKARTSASEVTPPPM